MSKLFAFNRRYGVDQTVWVRAETAKDARERLLDSEDAVETAGDVETWKNTTYRRLPAEDEPG